MNSYKEKGLYISYYYLPILVPRSIVAYKHLENSNYEFDVYCAETGRKEQDKGLKHNKNIKIYRDYKINGVASKFKWISRSIKFFQNNKDEYDFIMTSYMPLYSLVSGILIKRKHPNIPWISYYSDPPAINFNKRISLNKKIFMFFEKRCAKVSYKLADVLVFTNQRQLDYCLKGSKYKDKAVVLHHSFEEQLYPIKIKKKNDKIVISHFGRLFGSRNALPFFKALVRLKNENVELYNKLECKFFGSISEDQVNFVNQNNLDNIKLYDFVNYIDSLKYMSEADYLLCIDAFLDEKDNVFFPSKLADYIGSYTPIIAIVPKGTTKGIVDELSYITLDDNINTIYSLLIKLAKGEIRLIPRKDVIQKYSSKNVSKEMDKYIRDVLKVK